MTRRLSIILLAACACGSPRIQPTAGKSNPAGGGGGSGGQDAGFTISYPDATPLPPPMPGTIPDNTASCAGETHQAMMVPVDLLFLLDISGSMEESAGTQSKWVALREAVLSFVKDGKSAGLGVGMETFPPPAKMCGGDADCGAQQGACEQKGVCNPPADVATTEAACSANLMKTCDDAISPCTLYGLCATSGLRCTNMGQACPGGGGMCQPRPKYCTNDAGPACMSANYETPIFGVADLPAAAAGLEAALAKINPQGTTPTTPALDGALKYLRARVMANPDRKAALVLATDGLPTMCGALNTVDTAVASIAGYQAGTPSIATYIIGVFGTAQVARSQPSLQRMSTAGGTGMPFVLTTGTDLSQRFLDAINQIRGAALGCDFGIPRPTQGSLDFDKVNVQVKSPAGVQDLKYVDGADHCDPTTGGWYYDVNPAAGTPARVLLCPTSCNSVKMATGVSVDLRFGCKRIE